MKTDMNIPHRPLDGIYGDRYIYEAYQELYKAVHEYMNDAGRIGLSGSGHGARMIGRTKALTLRAKALEEIVIGCVGRNK